MDVTPSLVQTVCQVIFITVVFVFSLSWLVNTLKKYYTRINTGSSRVPEGESQPALLEQHKYEQAECRQRMQEEHESKASYYKDSVLKPQKEAKRLKIEKEYLKFLGPAWLTEGDVLGKGEDSSSDDDDDDDTSEARKAARKRKVLEQINQKVAAEAAAAAATAASRQKPKRVIKLPEEPDVSEDGVISVMLRTPIGTVCQRRFYASEKIQCLFDYITMQGFSQRLYAISTSYPRKLLDNQDLCFSDYNFGKRVALNIETRD